MTATIIELVAVASTVGARILGEAAPSSKQLRLAEVSKTEGSRLAC